MKKRILGIALAICMMIFCVPMGVFAAEAPSFSGGTGTQGDPWLIASQADLTALAEFLNSGVMQQRLILRTQVLETAMAITSNKRLILT